MLKFTIQNCGIIFEIGIVLIHYFPSLKNDHEYKSNKIETPMQIERLKMKNSKFIPFQLNSSNFNNFHIESFQVNNFKNASIKAYLNKFQNSIHIKG